MLRFLLLFAFFNGFSVFSVFSQELKPETVIAPEFQSYSISDEHITLPTLLKEKPVMLYFWATWCPYCLKETPKLVDFHNNYADKITIIGINVGVNDSIVKINDYVQKYQISFPIIFDEKNNISTAYAVNGTPVFVIISQTQEILYRGYRFPAGIEQVLED